MAEITEIDLVPEENSVTGVTPKENSHLDVTSKDDNAVTDVTESPSAPTSETLKPEDLAARQPPLPHIPHTKRPCWHVYDDWTVLDNGKRMKPGTYWLDYEEGKDGSITLKDTWVCSPLHIDAQTFDRRGNNFGRLLRFKNTAGHWKLWAMPMEMLRGSAEELRGELLSMGVTINTKFYSTIRDYLMPPLPPRKDVQCATQTGWHGSRAYVLPDKVIGPDADQVVFQSSQATHDEFATAGTLPAWQNGVAAMAVGNPMLALGLSCAFVGPLLALTNSEGGGIHMVDDSSSGKTTIARAASSVWGGKEYRRSWRMTANGLEAAAALFNDGFLVLDEISECDPKDVGEIAYSLGNGYGKQRANRSGAARSITRWLVFPLSNGERTIGTAIKEDGGKIKAGQSMRLLDLPTKRLYGAWDTLHGFPHGAALSDHISSEALANYGHAGRAFLERLTYDDQDFCERLSQMKSHPALRADGAEGQEKRAAGRFALIALAGELATEYGITSWPPGTATEATIIGYQTWKAQRGEGNEEKRQIFNALLDFIERHGDSRFSDMDSNGVQTVHNRAGYWKDENDMRRFYLNSDGMNEALKGHDFKLALDILEKGGVVSPGNARGERSRTIRVHNKPTRLYEVDFKRLQNDGNPVYPVNYPEE